MGREPGPLQEPAEQAFAGYTIHLQRRLTRQRERAWHNSLHSLVHRLPLDSPFRDAWDAANGTSGDFLTTFPNPARMTFIGLGFNDCLAHYLGLELPSLRDPSVRGLRIPQVDRRDRPLQPKHVDAHGYGIESAHMRGGDWKTAHDAVLRTLAADVKSAGLRAEAEYHGLLDGCLPAGTVGPSIDLYGLFAFGQPAGWREPQVRSGVPCELKRLSSGTERWYGPMRGGARGAQCTARADDVAAGRVRDMRNYDHAHHGLGTVRQQTARGDVGPCLARWQGLPAVQALVVGSWGESSPALLKLLDEVAAAHAGREWRPLGHASSDDAKGYFKRVLRQRWSCTFWREWALLVRVRRERVRAPPGQMRGGGPRQEATRLDWSDMLFEPNADAGYGRGGGAWDRGGD